MPFGGRDRTLFRLFGLPIKANASWLFLVVLVLVTLAQDLFPAWLGKDASWQVRWGLAVLGAIGLFASLIIHEMAHSLVARATGVPVAGITLFIFGGVSQLEDEPSTPGGEFVMAVAGPASSVVLGLCAAALYAAGRVLSWPREATALLAVLANVNFMLAAFNSLPAFPLDGGRVLRSILWGVTADLRLATRVAVGIGSFAGLAMMAGGALIVFYTRTPVTGIWFIVIGFFLRQAGYGSLQTVVMRDQLEGVAVRSFMAPQVVTVPQDLTVEDFVRDYVFHYRFNYYPVVDAFGHVVGLVSAQAPRAVPVDFWPRTPVHAVMQPVEQEMLLQPDAPANQALAALRRSRLQLAVVVEDGRPVGIVNLGDLMKFLALRMALTPGGRRFR